MTLLAWLHRLFSRKPSTGDGFVVFDRPDGGRIIVEKSYLRYLESSADQPTQASLQRMLTSAARVEISLGGIAEGRCISEEIVFATDLPADIESLREALRVEDGSAGHCMCHGDAGIVVFDGAGDQLAAIGVHHGHAIRWDHWKDDARLVDGWLLIDWLIDHGVAYPLSDEQMRERSLGAIAEFLGSSLLRVDRAIYATADRVTHVTVGVSRRYPEASFRFDFRSDQQAALQSAVRAYGAFVCGSPYRILLIPFPELSSWLGRLQPVTVSGGGLYWSIRVREGLSGLILEGLNAQQEVDLQPFLLRKRP